MFGRTHTEIVRDSIILSVHTARGGGYWLRLSRRQHDAVSADLILMALGLSRAAIPFAMLNVAGHVTFAQGDDWLGVAEDSIWERGAPVWPEGSGILNAPQNSLLVSQLSDFPGLMEHVEWFDDVVKVKRLP